MNYIFVATESIAGSKTIVGPITGKTWLVTPQGNWIADEFDRTDRWLNLNLTRWCSRVQKFVETKIFLIDPSFDQMMSMPMEE
jgi:hypothetical protein